MSRPVTRTVAVTATAVAVVATGAVAAGVAAASTSHATPHSTVQGKQAHRPSTTNFTVVERAITDTTADTGPKGDSLGDILAFANPIFTADDKTRIGSDNGSCIRTVVGAAYECSWTLTLAGGSLVVEGPFYDTKDSVLAITGGTGKWSGAGGEMTLHARDAAGSSYDFDYRVLHRD